MARRERKPINQVLWHTLEPRMLCHSELASQFWFGWVLQERICRSRLLVAFPKRRNLYGVSFNDLRAEAIPNQGITISLLTDVGE